MEALSSSIAAPRLTEISPSHQLPIPPLLKPPSFRRGGFLKVRENFDFLRLSSSSASGARRSWGRFRALAHDVSGSGGAEERELGNGPGFIADEGLSPERLVEVKEKSKRVNIVTYNKSGHFFPSNQMKSNVSYNHSDEVGITDKSEMASPVPGGSGTSGSRAGLFRTPISGGVQSATSAHDLPPPALAVRNLMEQARFAHLCTVMSRMHHRRAGYPFGSLVDFATDSIGHPIFSLSPLAIHTRNLLADPRCTLVVQIPGWSGLSNARVTIFGDVIPLPADQQEWARKQYIAKHQQWASQQWGNFYYYRMQNISDIYFIGGFGTVQWVDVKEYEAIQPDKIAADGGEQNLKELNAIFSKPLKELLSAEGEIDDAALISIDSKGTDIRVRQGAQFNIQRLSFEVEHGVETLDGAKKALQKIIKRDCGST